MQKTKTIQNLPSYLGLKDVVINIRPAIPKQGVDTIVDLSTVKLVSMSAVIELANLYQQQRNHIKFLNAKKEVENMIKAAIISQDNPKKTPPKSPRTRDISL